MPFCWRNEARKRIVPPTQAVQIVFISFFLSFPSFSNIRKTGIKEIAPSRNLVPLKVNEPRLLSAATLCATKANPHIIAVINSIIVDFAEVFIISSKNRIST